MKDQMIRTITGTASTLVAIFFLLACSPAPSPTPQVNRTITFALSSEPDVLNPYLASQRAAGEVHVFVIEGLLSVNDQGEFFPALAKQVPTKENGGVSNDGLTITYNLKENVIWSDGQPFTCDDVKFTWEATTNPKSGAVSTTGYREIESVSCPNATTAVIKFKSFYAPYLVPFWTILPRHATGDPAQMSQWAYNRQPLGTGPFKIAEWVSGDHITLVRNERYREPNKPQIDTVIFRFVPSRDVALQLIKTGEITLVGDLVESNLSLLAQMPDVITASSSGPRAERLLFNLGDPSVDPPDATKQPHPILGDAHVREALELAINKREIVDKLLNGKADIGTNELHAGWWTCNTPPSEFSPDKARQLLDAAGWKIGADGIRTVQSAQFAKDGTRLRLKLAGPTGDPLREQVEQLLLDYWKAIGVEAFIENAPTATLFGTWDANGVARHGKFDILIYTTGPFTDPHDQVDGYFASRNIPRPENRGSGLNYSRWVNATADQAIELASREADPTARRTQYCRVMKQVTRERPQVYLYSRLSIAAYRSSLQNFKINVWKNLGWNASEWNVK